MPGPSGTRAEVTTPTWYTAPWPSKYPAYTVRPDLWPPGTVAGVKSYVDGGYALAGYWRPGPLDLVPRSDLPGVGEALVLAGQVFVAQTADSDPWVPKDSWTRSISP